MTILERIEKELVDKWQQRQDLLDGSKARLAREAEQARVQAEAREKLLPDVREREQDYNQRLVAWLDQGLDLFQEEKELRRDASSAYGRSRVLRVTGRFKALVKNEKERLMVWVRGPRNYGGQSRNRARQLRDFAKEQAKRAKSMVGGGGSRYQAEQRIAQAKAAADRIEGKTPDGDAMLITAEQARGV